MIVLDSSAIVAYALGERDAHVFASIIENEDIAAGWPTLLEAAMVLRSRSPIEGERAVPDIIGLRTFMPIDFSAAHFHWASLAHERFGRGRGHPAQLNFGDCMTYAVARELDALLLFKGGDFARTDVRAHPASLSG